MAALLNADEKDLWPVVAHRPTTRRAEPATEVLNTYPHRWAVPRATWHAFFNQATTEIGILAYAALFLAKTPESSAPSATAPKTPSPSGSCSATPTAHESENEAKKRASAPRSPPRSTTS
ncbi:MAG TPA: hypothetical protein VFU43_19800 [Streptosporangiaceae bacterium]|nr:hypothetical protein [Streptosporangiaceae bacterium]